MSTATQQTPSFDPLAAYAEWFTRQPFAIPPSIELGVTRVGNFSGLILHRSGQYQTQLWICDPRTVIPRHNHPHVDSIQMSVSGIITLQVENDSDFEPQRAIAPGEKGFIRVRPGVDHWASIGEGGGCFVTFQHWLKGEPESVELDWVGRPIDEEHAATLKK